MQKLKSRVPSFLNTRTYSKEFSFEGTNGHHNQTKDGQTAIRDLYDAGYTMKEIRNLSGRPLIEIAVILGNRVRPRRVRIDTRYSRRHR